MAEENKAPEQMSMDLIEPNFGTHEALLVKQTMRGCLQECLGCEARSEFKIAPFDKTQLQGYKVSEMAMNAPETMYALEESSCLCRLCWRDGRPFNMKVSQGANEGGPGIVNFNKPCGFPLNFRIPTKDGSVDVPCCCLLPKVDTQKPDGTSLGSTSQYICDQNCFVPKLNYLEDNKVVYVVKPETCCGGCCIACSCSGKGCLYIPFYFHDPTSMEPVGGAYDQEGTPQIRKVWAGLKKECCSTADHFVLVFPPGIDAKRKAGLLGMTFLIDFTVFENQQDQE